jgi:hypothetical protein
MKVFTTTPFKPSLPTRRGSQLHPPHLHKQHVGVYHYTLHTFTVHAYRENSNLKLFLLLFIKRNYFQAYPLQHTDDICFRSQAGLDKLDQRISYSDLWPFEDFEHSLMVRGGEKRRITGLVIWKFKRRLLACVINHIRLYFEVEGGELSPEVVFLKKHSAISSAYRGPDLRFRPRLLLFWPVAEFIDSFRES